jgi:hypothetical protein
VNLFLEAGQDLRLEPSAGTQSGTIQNLLTSQELPSIEALSITNLDNNFQEQLVVEFAGGNTVTLPLSDVNGAVNTIEAVSDLPIQGIEDVVDGGELIEQRQAISGLLVQYDRFAVGDDAVQALNEAGVGIPGAVVEIVDRDDAIDQLEDRGAEVV